MGECSTSSDVDDAVLEFSNLKISALRNAALISSYVKTVTIGPKADDGCKQLLVTLTKVDNCHGTLANNKVSIKSRLGPKILEESNDGVNNLWKSPKDNLTLSMASYYIQQERKEVVRRNLKPLRYRFSESDRILKEKMAIEKKEAAKRQENRVYDSEKAILEDLELQQKRATLWEKKRNEEYKENLERIKERTILLKQEEETRIQQKKEISKKREQVELIFTNHKVFRNSYQDLIEVMKSVDDRALVQRILTESSPHIKQCSTIFDDIIGHCKSGKQTDEDVELSQRLKTQMDKLCTQMIQDYNDTTEQYKKEKEAQEEMELKKLEEQRLQSLITHQQLSVKEETAADGTVPHAALNTVSRIGSDMIATDNWRLFAEHKCFNEEYSKNFEMLKQDTSLKKFRFECQKAVNIPVNAIGNNSTQHLQDKLRKLEGLLSGQSVPVGDFTISAAQHPQGIAFCTDLIARKIVKQGSLVAINPQSAFPLATVVIALWKRFPDFGKLLLGYFYQECPFLVPIYPIREADMKDLEYYRLIGYDVNSEGIIETDHSYLQRMSGLGRLFFALMITPCKDGEHPFGIRNAWKWLAFILNSAPKPEISATLILQCLEITGNNQLKVYKTVFNKMLKALANQYMHLLVQVDDGGPKVRLQQFLEKVTETGTFQHPIQASD